MPTRELAFSESTLHWLSQGDTFGQIGPDGSSAHVVPADVERLTPGWRRDLVLLGGASLLALFLVWILRSQAHEPRPLGEVAAGFPTVRTAGPAEALTRQAERALGAGHGAQALELATRALAIDPRLPDAFVVIGSVHQTAGQAGEAKAAYRRYLELSPGGRYAPALRRLLTLLRD